MSQKDKVITQPDDMRDSKASGAISESATEPLQDASKSLMEGLANTSASDRFTDTDAALLAELLFTYFPFVIAVIVQVYRSDITQILHKSEWALASAVLAGQTIVKFIAGVMDAVNDSRRLKSSRRLYVGGIGLVITGLIVLLLAPSLVVLTLIEILNGQGASIPTWLLIFQVALLICSTVVFLRLGRIKEAIFDKKTGG